LGKNIDEENSNIKTFIKPIFNSESFENEDPSLEEIVGRGETARDKGSEKNCRINLPTCPELVTSLLLYLRRKHERLKSLSAVCRYVSKAGFIEIESIENLRTIERGLRISIKQGGELDRLRFTEKSYSFEHRLGHTKRPITCYCWEWVYGGIVDVAHTLGLKSTTLTVIALCFGLARSKIWVPELHRVVFEDEAKRFTD